MKLSASPILYHIYVRSFFDSNGDGVGDLDGIREKLDYFAWLNVDGILLSPIFESPLSDFGYDITNLSAINPEYGDMSTFKALVEEAEARGIAVFIDFVANHTSSKHPWFLDSASSKTSEKADWYIWSPARADGTPPNNWLTIFGESAWRWHPTRGEYYLHNTLSNQPDLNYRNPHVVRQLMKDVRFWLDTGVAGLRLDSVNLFLHDDKLRNNPPRHLGWQDEARSDPYRYQSQRYNISRPENIHLLKQLRVIADGYDEKKWLLGSLSDPSPYAVIDRYTSEGDALDAANIFESLSLCQNVHQVGEQFTAFFNAVHPGLGCWGLGNHDIARTVSRWQHANNQPAAAKMLLTLLCSLQGVISIYQGEELGLPEAHVSPSDRKDLFGQQVIANYVGRDGCRTPLPWKENAPFFGFSSQSPWLPIDDEHKAFSIDAQQQDPQSTLNFTRDMLAWRQQQPALREGSCRMLAFNEALMVFERHHASQTLVIAINGSNQEATIRLNLPSPAKTLPLPHMQVSPPTQNEALHLAPWQVWVGELYSN
ncbi:alpha-amylase family glycosyl hydrolase [Enterovibrio norvegicus]|uniref:alpha-amylase family glycosyl hydrolase n=1 Tax=Enterovibrio norvegicus TaxID=188144 RepID=UPI000C82E13C|nr:alpha-amylase family glycosyl hydrolase [Enterovibrio norvegicus]PML78369.1 alpha-glucosidase [Enterovibrio norvegicus]PMN72470.1 alpha-glucosidase [Enterovibrio norvegicus]